MESTQTTNNRSGDLRNYAIVTGAYWADTITDGALRVLVLFYFYELGYSPFQVAMLFLFYEVFGIVTNLVGGFLAARFGLKATLIGGLSTQLVALSMLAFAPQKWLVVPYVMVSQALSGIAKDLTKMSSKSAVKLVVPEDASDTLFKWVAILTGSKNALKGVGFFVGGMLLTLIGFQSAVIMLWVLVGGALVTVLVLMRGSSLGVGSAKAKFRHMFSNTRAINLLAAARLFLFGARDVWFVVGLPVFLRTEQGWSFWQAGAFLGAWVIGYGMIQASSPSLMRRYRHGEPTGVTASGLAFILSVITAAIALALQSSLDPSVVVVVGLLIWGVVFAFNSAVHSFLILDYAHGDKVAMNVGFYYMANACGRLLGTVLSGLLYQWQGLTACLIGSVCFALVAGTISLLLPRHVSTPAGAVANG